MPRFGYDESVFINCPFDLDYKPIFEALVFAVHDCGYVARCALEVDDGSQVRVEKIFSIIAGCRLGIHDISRTELDDGSSLPRFNMPLELGFFLGAKRFGTGKQKQKQCLVLDCEPYRYQKFCSDIAGQDIRAHQSDPDVAIGMVRDWLQVVSRDAGIIIPGGSRMAARYHAFQEQLPALCDVVKLDRAHLIFSDYVTLVVEWLKGNSW